MLDIAVLLNTVKLTLREAAIEYFLDLKIFLGSLGNTEWLNLLMMPLCSQAKIVKLWFCPLLTAVNTGNSFSLYKCHFDNV